MTYFYVFNPFLSHCETILIVVAIHKLYKQFQFLYTRFGVKIISISTFLKNTIFSPEVKAFHIFIKLAHKNGWRFINRHVFCQPTHFVRGQAQCSLNTFNEYMSLLLSSKIVFFMYIVIVSILFKNSYLFIFSNFKITDI